MSNDKRSELAENFARHLRRLHEQEDRAALARLRRGLGKEPGSVWDMHPLVQPWLPRNLPAWDENACYLVAALFASHPEPGGHGSLGTAFASLKAKDPNNSSIEKRFVALLDCDREELPLHLRHAVSRLASAGISINWARLLDDVLGWGHLARFVQRQWSRDFWTSEAGDDSPAVIESTTPKES